MSSQSHSTSTSTNTSSYSYSTSTSSSISSSTDPNSNQSHSKSYTEKMSSDSNDGTTYERTTTETGKPTLIESAYVPANTAAATSAVDHGSSGLTQRRVEDISEEEAEKRYLENMEEEYAKREGGA